MLYIDEQDTSAFKRCKISWTRTLLDAATFQGLNGKLIPEGAMSLCSHVRGSSGYPMVRAWSGAARRVRELALTRVINHTKSTFYFCSDLSQLEPEQKPHPAEVEHSPRA